MSTMNIPQFARSKKHKFKYSKPKRTKTFGASGFKRNMTNACKYETPKCVSDAKLYLESNQLRFQPKTWTALNTPGYEWLKPRVKEIRCKVPGEKFMSDISIVAAYFPAQYRALMRMHAANSHKFKLCSKQQ